MAQQVKPLQPGNLSLLLQIHGERRKLNSDFRKRVHACLSLPLNKINGRKKSPGSVLTLRVVWVRLVLLLP